MRLHTRRCECCRPLPPDPPPPPPLPRSLYECGGGVIADGRLLDLIRRLYAFGTTLLKLDLRQVRGEPGQGLTTKLGLTTMGVWARG